MLLIGGDIPCSRSVFPGKVYLYQSTRSVFMMLEPVCSGIVFPYIKFYLVLLSLYRHSFTLSAHACERTTVRPTLGFQRRDMLQHIHLHSDRLRSVLIYA